MRFRRDADKEPQPDEEDYELENEDSDRPKVKRDTTDDVKKMRSDVHALNYDLK